MNYSQKLFKVLRYTCLAAVLILGLVTIVGTGGSSSDNGSNNGDGSDNGNGDSLIEGEFVVMEESFIIGYPDPWSTQTDYYRAVITENGELMILETPLPEDVETRKISRKNLEEGGYLASITFFVWDSQKTLEFTLEVSDGILVGERREERRLPEAQKTVDIVYSGEKISMTGYVKEDSWAGFEGVKVFEVSTITKI